MRRKYQRVTCDCGSNIYKSYLENHLGSDKHKRWAEGLPPLPFPKPRGLARKRLVVIDPDLLALAEERKELATKVRPMQTRLKEINKQIREKAYRMRGECIHLGVEERQFNKYCKARNMWPSYDQCRYCILHLSWFEARGDGA